MALLKKWDYISIRTNGVVAFRSGHWPFKWKDVKDGNFEDFESIF